MSFIKADGVPLVATLFAIMMTVGGLVIGVQALLDPTTAINFVDGADKMGIAWGGRNAGLGVAMAVAILLRSVHAYAAGFAAAMLREFSDLIAGLSEGGSFDSASAIVLVMLALELVFLAICVRNARSIDLAKNG